MSGKELELRLGGSISEFLLTDPQKLVALLRSLDVSLFEYFPREDLFITYNHDLSTRWQCRGYLSIMAMQSHILPEDQPLMRQLLQERDTAPTEIRIAGTGGRTSYVVVTLVSVTPNSTDGPVLAGTIKDITLERERESILREKAHRDALTMLYNKSHGQKLVNDYLRTKSPFVSCGLLVIDVDFFKQVNDTYGHLFGDTVLTEIARLLTYTFDLEDTVIRAGGDEFAVFVKNITHTALIHKTSVLLEEVRALSFSGNGCTVTCSVGVCFLPENTFGYTYQQLFADADWALYRAKKFGSNRYEFCDNLQRFETVQRPLTEEHPDSSIDDRYLHNDVISTAFEIFEKTPNFDMAIHLLLKVVGLQLQLDRITVIRTNTRDRTTERAYLWTAPGIPEVLPTEATFTKEDFLTLFHSYDDYGTAVLDYDKMDAYSDGAKALLMQGNAKTVVYAAMYCEGHYTGAVSFVSCDSTRHWSSSQRCQLGELTKIISAHIAKSQSVNFSQRDSFNQPGYDSLTELISFTRFREETERIIIGRTRETYVFVYSDFENFKYLNQKYGYRRGDQLLKDFASYIISTLSTDTDVYFTRVVGDQFILFKPYDADASGISPEQAVDNINREFVRRYADQFPGVTLRIRSGLYLVEPSCASSSAAIDAANYARRQICPGAPLCACVYTRQLEAAQSIENSVLNGMAEAIDRHEFEVYLQPKFSLSDRAIIGAEALVRWRRADGTLLMPDTFIPVYERTGRILDLDFYVFEEVAAFLAKNARLGRRQVPISINASILHASNPDTVQRYLSILKKYDVSPSLTEIELTETATVEEFDGVVELFRQFQDVGILTSLDDFGAGYSVLNAVIDLPVNTVKIDRLLLNRCEASEHGVYFLEQIISLIKGMGCGVLCEGIETEQQLQLLQDVGCEAGQGFLFSRPIPMDSYEKLLYGKESE